MKTWTSFLKPSGKNGRVLWFSLTVTAASTIVSPNCTTADPAACFAMRPVSMIRGRPAKLRSTRCVIAYLPRNNTKRAGRSCAPARMYWDGRLVAETKILNELPVAFDVRPLHVVQETTPLADHLQQPAAAVMVRLMGAVLGDRRCFFEGHGVIFSAIPSGVVRAESVEAQEFTGLVHPCKGS